MFSDVETRNGIKGQNSKVVSSALESLERDSKSVMLYIVRVLHSEGNVPLPWSMND